MKTTVKEFIEKELLIFDGAMGTYYSKRNRCQALACEMANIAAPEEIKAIHREYIEAGCKAIMTNTFGVNRKSFGGMYCESVIDAGYKLAVEAAGEDAFVFADIGPIPVTDDDDLNEEYRYVIDRFFALGAKNFYFETNALDVGLHEAAAYVKQLDPNAYVMVGFAAQPDGFTCAGENVKDLLKRADEDENIDCMGLNCISSARHMVKIAHKLEPMHKPMMYMPDGGYPTVVGGRTYYDSGADYFAEQMSHLAATGAKVLGGCCGTTPKHIAAMVQELKAMRVKAVAPEQKTEVKTNTHTPSRFWAELCDPDKKPFAVELDPPEGTDISKFMEGAARLRDGGVSIMTIADCPVARARMDSSLLACKVRRELGLETLPHMTCRDRNLNATKALLLGLSAEDVQNVLVITGDPIPTGFRDEVKSVYNFNSRLLANYIKSLKEDVLPEDFQVYGALNINANNFKIQLKLAKDKVEKGMSAFFTQPVLTEQAFENLKLARQELDAKILGGIIPVVSQRNAMFMNSEIAGINVDERIIDLYEGADRTRGEELAVEISTKVAKGIAPYVDGFYLITPFTRTELMVRIMDSIRDNL